MVYLCPHGDDGCTMSYLCDPPFRLDSGCEIPDVAGSLCDRRFRIHMNEGVPVDPVHKIAQIGLNVQPVQRAIYPSRISPQVALPLHQMDIMSLAGYGEGTGHAGNTPADHQSPPVDRQIKFLQRCKVAGARH